jgi:hypothetical protein
MVPKLLHIASVLVGAVTATFIMSACAPKVSNEWRDPEFNSEHFRTAALVIGGVGSSLSIPEQGRLSPLLDSVLYFSLRKELTTLKISEPGLTRLKLGNEFRQRLVTSFVAKNMIDEADAATIRNGFADAPVFLLFGNLVQNTVVRKSVTMNAGQADQHEVENNERRMRFLFALYDARSGRQVWRCDISAARPTESAEEDPTENYFDLSNPVGSLLNQLVGSGDQGGSAAGYSTGRVMRVIFEQLARRLAAQQ